MPVDQRNTHRAAWRAASMARVPFEPHATVGVALVGAGNRARQLLSNLVHVAGVEVVALVDVSTESLAETTSLLTGHGRPAPAVGDISRTEEIFARDDVDLVVVSSPWETHTPVAVAAMRAGKHVAVEVPAAVSVEQCWELVDTSEATRRHCVMLENCCYGRSELAVLNMVRRGLFGELLHGEAAYIHDLRRNLMTNQWRRQWHTRLNGNIYPTHGLGPVATYLDINRGDRFTSLVSVSTRTTSAIQDWARAHPTEPIVGDPAAERYVTGDINTSILATARGRTVLLQHQVIGPRPYDRRNLIVGTNGAFSDFPPRIYLEDKGGLSGFADEEEYVELDAIADQVGHELWRAEGERAARIGGHGGMDYLMLFRLISCMREGVPPDMDVYDAATWSAPIAFTAASVAAGGCAVELPDFTRGDWYSSRPGIP